MITTTCSELSQPLHLPFIHFAFSGGCEWLRKSKTKKAFKVPPRERTSAHEPEKAFNSSHPRSSSTVIEDAVRTTTLRREFPENIRPSHSHEASATLPAKGSMKYRFPSPLDTESRLSIRVRMRGHVLRKHLRSDCCCRVVDRSRKLFEA